MGETRDVDIVTEFLFLSLSLPTHTLGACTPQVSVPCSPAERRDVRGLFSHVESTRHKPSTLSPGEATVVPLLSRRSSRLLSSQCRAEVTVFLSGFFSFKREPAFHLALTPPSWLSYLGKRGVCYLLFFFFFSLARSCLLAGPVSA